MRPFSDLEAACDHQIRKVIGDPVREKMKEEGNNIDIDSPIGANDTKRLFCAFINGELMFIEYDHIPKMIRF